MIHLFLWGRNIQKYQKINKQIALQFKSYPEFDDTVTEEIEQGILYHAGKQIIVQLTAAYVKDTQGNDISGASVVAYNVSNYLIENLENNKLMKILKN